MSAPPRAGDPRAFNGSGLLPVYELHLPPDALARLEASPTSNDTVSGSLSFQGQTHDGVAVRYRGAWARTWPKKALKIIFPKDHPFADRHVLNLNSAWRDPAFVREILAYHVYAACGVPAPRAQLVQVTVNGEFHGVFVEVEQPDKPLLARFNLAGASLYKANSRANRSDERDLGSVEAFAAEYEKQTRKGEGFEELQQFCHSLATTTNLPGFFVQEVDVERYVSYLAATALVQHWDSYNKNHYLARDLNGSHRWCVIPWDLDRTFGDHWDWTFRHADLPAEMGIHAIRGVTGWNRMQERFLSDPGFHRRYVERIRELLETEFTPGKLFPLLDSLEASLAGAAEADRARWPGPAGNLHAGILGVKAYIENRRAFLQASLDPHSSH